MVTIGPCPAEIAASRLVLPLNLSAAGGDELMSRQGPSTPARTASLQGWLHPASSALGHDPARAAHEQAQQTLAKTFARGAGPTLPGALTQSHTPLP